MSAVDVLAVMDREIAARELAPSGHAVGCIEHPPGARFPCSCNGPQLTEARAAVAELIEVLDVVETWMDVHALPTLGDDTDGGHALLANVREVLALARVGGAK